MCYAVHIFIFVPFCLVRCCTSYISFFASFCNCFISMCTTMITRGFPFHSWHKCASLFSPIVALFRCKSSSFLLFFFLIALCFIFSTVDSSHRNPVCVLFPISVFLRFSYFDRFLLCIQCLWVSARVYFICMGMSM